MVQIAFMKILVDADSWDAMRDAAEIAIEGGEASRFSDVVIETLEQRIDGIQTAFSKKGRGDVSEEVESFVVDWLEEGSSNAPEKLIDALIKYMKEAGVLLVVPSSKEDDGKDEEEDSALEDDELFGEGELDEDDEVLDDDDL
jgi:hypothetical protein